MAGALDALMHAGLIARTGISAGADRQQALNAAGEFLLRAYAGSDYGKAMGMLGPAVALAWCEAGFPSVKIGHRLAASMMCSVFTKEACEQVRPPWRSFHVSVPAGILGGPADMLVLFAHNGTVPTITFYDGARVDVAFESSLTAYATLVSDGFTWNSERPFPDEWGSMDRVAKETKLMGRVLAGVCAEMDTPRIRETVALGPRHTNGRNKRGEPAAWVFQLSRNVAVDLREHVRAYVSGARGGELSVQHLVRGHWKRQVTGKDRAERTWIHIEPYWRGDPNAPLPLRSHTLK